MPKYVGCVHLFAYGGVQYVIMQKYSAGQQDEMMIIQLHARGITIGAGGHQATATCFPTFVELYSELFRDTDRNRNTLVPARQMYDHITQESGPPFKLPKWRTSHLMFGRSSSAC